MAEKYENQKDEEIKRREQILNERKAWEDKAVNENIPGYRKERHGNKTAEEIADDIQSREAGNTH